jgi:N utilization substance protein B
VTSRHRARARALQALYAWEAQGHPGDVERLAAEIAGDDPFARALVRAVAEHRDEIDRRIAEAATNWRIERMAAVDRNVLRLAIAEMLYLRDAPGPVCIHEAIRLAERFGTEASPRFVNGVLDAILRSLRAEAGSPGEG